VPTAAPHLSSSDDGDSPAPELIIPEYDEGDAESPGTPGAEPTGPADCIADFKATRERNERLALGVLLNILLLFGITASITITWMMNVHNPDVNPFLQVVNGTARLTSESHMIYTDMFLVRYMVQCLVVSIPLDLEALAGQLRWSDIAAGQVPQLASVGVWALYIFTELFSCISVYGKYGWPSMLVAAISWLRLAVWKFEFASAVQPGEQHPLTRQSTLLEWLTLMRASWGLLLYPPFELFCIHDGQWDGKSAGRFGGLLLVIVQIALNVLWWMKRGKVCTAACCVACCLLQPPPLLHSYGTQLLLHDSEFLLRWMPH
jgi:hypothetical protein